MIDRKIVAGLRLVMVGRAGQSAIDISKLEMLGNPGPVIEVHDVVLVLVQEAHSLENLSPPEDRRLRHRVTVPELQQRSAILVFALFKLRRLPVRVDLEAIPNERKDSGPVCKRLGNRLQSIR